VRRSDGGFDNARVGSADAGSFDSANNTVKIVLSLDNINAIAEPDIDVGSRLIGLRGISFAGGGIDISVPVIGRVTGADVERDFGRGGMPFVVGSEEATTFLDCSDPAVTRFGGWHTVQVERASDGHYCRNVGTGKANPQAYLSFTFAGCGVDVQMITGPRGGNAEVLIDDVSQGKLDFYSAGSDLTFGVTKTYSTAPGTHTFRLNVLNDAAKLSTQPRNIIYIDGFLIRGNAQGTGNPTETSTETVGTVSPTAIVSQALATTSSTKLLTGILDVPAGANLGLIVLDPLGTIVGQSSSSGTPKIVQVIPKTTGAYLLRVINTSSSSVSFSLYQVATQGSASAP
jgi:hypothetical protein